MEPIRHNSPDIRRPTQSGVPGRQPVQRRVFSDFTTRPIAPSTNPMRPVAPAQPQPSAPTFKPAAAPVVTPTPSAIPTPQAAPRPVFTSAPQLSSAPAPSNPAPRPLVQAAPTPAYAQPTPPQTYAQPAPVTPQQDELVPTAFSPTTKPKVPKPNHETAHAGLAGFICFVVIAGLLLSPFIRGKILDNFLGSSQSFSSGDQALACIDTLQNMSSSQVYNTKLGSPIVYKYSTTTTQRATCDNKPQTAIVGHTSQFNPLGLLIDLALAVAVSVVVAKIWRKLFGNKD